MEEQLELFSREQLKSLELKEIKISLEGIKVIKRDGRIVPFNQEKIKVAILKAASAVGKIDPIRERKIELIVDSIIREIRKRFFYDIQIYEIQNIVEHELLEAKEYAIAEEYITYRTQRDFERSKATDINFSIHKLLNKDQA